MKTRTKTDLWEMEAPLNSARAAALLIGHLSTMDEMPSRDRLCEMLHWIAERLEGDIEQLGTIWDQLLRESADAQCGG